jgi:hypothetical protein
MSCPAQDGGLSKGIKYSYTLFGVGEAAGDALRTAVVSARTGPKRTPHRRVFPRGKPVLIGEVFGIIS